uniref:ribonuclease H n=1 Tax=Laticauda laticaudata TaxID=8630 RepID=A0A8C5WX28_LATLA
VCRAMKLETNHPGFSLRKKNIIRNYFENLHTQDEIEREKIDRYLKEKVLPSISEDSREMLNKEITQIELKNAVYKQKSNNIPGPDGIPRKFCKNMFETVEPLMLEVYNEVLLEAKLPKSWFEAYITLIPKEGMHHLQIQNYRPILLLDANYKIFMTIIAERMKKLQIRNNIRTVINMKFGSNFEKMVVAICSMQKASVIVNSDFTITKGVRQGCPLSSLIFILSIEILLVQIRNKKQITGIKIKKEEHKTQAFADDLIFFTENPIDVGTILLKEIEEFVKMAGLKINKNKTEILIKNLTENQERELKQETELQITNKI